MAPLSGYEFEKHAFDARVDEAAAVRRKYPGRVPVIVERHRNERTLPLIDRNKFLVPADLSFAQFMFVVRKRLRLHACESLFLLCDDMLPSSSLPMGDVYGARRAADGFLYFTYAAENAFG